MKIRIVYDVKTKRIPKHIWNDDGTVSVPNLEDTMIVSMIESRYVDFENGLILEDKNDKKEKIRH